MLEADFQKWVTQVATLLGWKWWHVPAPMVAAGNEWHPAKQAAGLPDLILIHDDPPRIILAELKSNTGRISKSQRRFLTAARDVAVRSVDSIAPEGRGQEAHTLGVYVWTPGMENIIEATLKSRSLPVS